jgi:hypothetical protein
MVLATSDGDEGAALIETIAQAVRMRQHRRGSDQLDNLVVLRGRCHRRPYEREKKLREIVQNEPGDR